MVLYIESGSPTAPAAPTSRAVEWLNQGSTRLSGIRLELLASYSFRFFDRRPQTTDHRPRTFCAQRSHCLGSAPVSGVGFGVSPKQAFSCSLHRSPSFFSSPTLWSVRCPWSVVSGPLLLPITATNKSAMLGLRT